MDDSHQYNEMALLVFDRTHWIAATHRAIQPSMGYTTHTHARILSKAKRKIVMHTLIHIMFSQ